ncbi:hypothetical protein LPJ66_007366 [Kickxella alabastrina]|uniref:Uncharacterized protein n=1 Tax=Kickxella alabastrina TaxID=61397 RepID=A0ACC1I9B2_9FUNG|nr:hypothetical protein LPJ66_007366 [Kickxella alabastrina]
MAAKSEAKAKRDELRKIKRRRIDKLEKIDGRLQTYLKSLELLGRSIGATESAEEEGDDSMNQESKHGAKASAEDADEPVKEPKRIREIRGGGTPLRVGTPRM